jgi:outer membrane protein TolC
VKNSLELATLAQATKFGRSKLWTTWLTADGLNPLSMGLRLARNIAGGSDRAALKLDLAELARRQAEVEVTLRFNVAQTVADYETAERRRILAESRLSAHTARLRILEAGYRLGDGSTQEMLQLWATGEELKVQIMLAEADATKELRRLRSLVMPQHQ